MLDQLVVEVLRGACILLLLRLAALSSFATAFLPFLGLLLYRHPSNLTSSPPCDAATLAATTPYSVKKAKEGWCVAWGANVKYLDPQRRSS